MQSLNLTSRQKPILIGSRVIEHIQSCFLYGAIKQNGQRFMWRTNELNQEIRWF